MTNFSKKIRVMIVDDSAVIRSIIEKILREDDTIEVCGYASNGQQAVDSLLVCNPDIVLLDIEMPIMDGITAIPHLLSKKKDVRIIMCSTLSERGAQISIKAMSLGAADCILKPTGSGNIQESRDFHTKLLQLVKQVGNNVSRLVSVETTAITRRSKPNVMPKIVAIGSSTGGPNALEVVLKSLEKINLPIVITQHIPPSFTKIMAAHLTKCTGFECLEAEEGMILKAGTVYLAPGGYHMNFVKRGENVSVVLDDGPLENFCKPAVDSMLRSLISIYKHQILMVMLTGMGEDGYRESKQLVDAGGILIAQDKDTSVVWGMPGAVAKAGICNDILPLSNIGPTISGLCREARM